MYSRNPKTLEYRRKYRQKCSHEKAAFARKLRKKPTRSEAMLYERLKGGQLFGLSFKRERVLLGWIADFYCAEQSLIVEVDGGYHDDPDQKKKDAFRDHIIRKDRGIHTLRIPAELVEKSPAKAVGLIAKYILEQKRAKRK